MINNTLEIYSAYGRINNTIKSVKNDFNNGLDFNSELGFLSIRDLNLMLEKKLITVYYSMGSSIIYIIRFMEIQNWVKNNE